MGLNACQFAAISLHLLSTLSPYRKNVRHASSKAEFEAMRSFVDSLSITRRQGPGAYAREEVAATMRAKTLGLGVNVNWACLFFLNSHY